MVDLANGSIVEIELPGVVVGINDPIAQGPPGPPGSVDSVNGDNGPDVVLTQDQVLDGSTFVQFSATEKTKLAGLNSATLLDRANHTGTQASGTISDFTEAVQDAVAALLASGTQVSLSYNDAGNSLTISATGADAETMRDTIGAALVGVGNISVTVNDGGDTITISTTATVNDTDANLKNRANHTGTQAQSTIVNLTTDLAAKKTDSMSTGKLLGRGTAGTGAIEEITIGSGLTLTGTTIAATSGSGTGDVVGPASSVDGDVVLFNGTTGKLLKSSGVGLATKAQAIPFAVTLSRASDTALTANVASAPSNTELFASVKSTRNVVDLANATQVRLTCMVIANSTGATTASFKLSYMTTSAATWSGTDTGADVVVGSGGGAAGTMRDSGWVNLPSGAKVNNCHLAALVGVAGTTPATISSLTAYFR